MSVTSFYNNFIIQLLYAFVLKNYTPHKLPNVGNTHYYAVYINYYCTHTTVFLYFTVHTILFMYVYNMNNEIRVHY